MKLCYFINIGNIVSGKIQNGVIDMKKMISFVLVVGMVLFVAGCGRSNDRFFDAEVLEIHENSLLVKPIGGKDPPSAQQVLLNLRDTNQLPDMEEGTQIRVMFGGEVEETEPAKIEIVFAIYRLDEIKTNYTEN